MLVYQASYNMKVYNRTELTGVSPKDPGSHHHNQFPRLETLPVDVIHSHWFKDLMTEWRPDSNHITHLIDTIATGNPIAPMLVVQEGDRYIAIDGVHRLYAYRKVGLTEIQAVVIEGDWASTEEIRQALLKLKAYDEKTGYKYNFRGAMAQWSLNYVGTTHATRRRKLLIVFARNILAKLRRRLLKIAFR